MSKRPNDEVYRIRRLSDGRWYGRKDRFGGDESCWKRSAGRYLRRPAVEAILKGSSESGQPVRRTLRGAEFEIVAYRLREHAVLTPEAFMESKA